jgi:hypothetical protein
MRRLKTRTIGVIGLGAWGALVGLVVYVLVSELLR